MKVNTTGYYERITQEYSEKSFNSHNIFSSLGGSFVNCGNLIKIFYPPDYSLKNM